MTRKGTHLMFRQLDCEKQGFWRLPRPIESTRPHLHQPGRWGKEEWVGGLLSLEFGCRQLHGDLLRIRIAIAVRHGSTSRHFKKHY